MSSLQRACTTWELPRGALGTSEESGTCWKGRFPQFSALSRPDLLKCEVVLLFLCFIPVWSVDAVVVFVSLPSLTLTDTGETMLGHDCRNLWWPSSTNINRQRTKYAPSCRYLRVCQLCSTGLTGNLTHNSQLAAPQLCCMDKFLLPGLMSGFSSLIHVLNKASAHAQVGGD